MDIVTEYSIEKTDKLISLEDFLEIGFEGLETYFDAKKFNL